MELQELEKTSLYTMETSKTKCKILSDVVFQIPEVSNVMFWNLYKEGELKVSNEG